MNEKLKAFVKSIQKRLTFQLTIFWLLLVCVMALNYISIHKIEHPYIRVAVSINSMLFLFIGLMFISVFMFVFVHLSHYKTGRYFAAYTLFIGFSTALVPCLPLNYPLVNITVIMLTLVSCFLLYQTLGLLTQLVKKKLYRFLRLLLLTVLALAAAAQILTYAGLESAALFIAASESSNIAILSCAGFSVLTMVFYYRRSNSYAKKQIQVLSAGVGLGILLFLITTNLPYIYIVQTLPNERVSYLEFFLDPSLSLVSHVPLLLFSGISAAIVLVLFKREFISRENRIGLGEYIGSSAYLFAANAILFFYANIPVWVLILFNLILFIPVAYVFVLLLKRGGSSPEDLYQWNLAEELEKERQQLSAFLHDEVLQSVIALYRQVQAEKTGNNGEMKPHLSRLISQIRDVSHNLYPTIVEDVGLEQSLDCFIAELRAGYPDVEISCEYQISHGALPKSVMLTFYRIIKELATNAVKHSGCTRLFINISEGDSGFFIRVKDNGQGFQWPQNERLLVSSHMGLYTVKRLIAQLQGQMSFQSGSKRGTDFHIYIPEKEALLNVHQDKNNGN